MEVITPKQTFIIYSIFDPTVKHEVSAEVLKLFPTLEKEVKSVANKLREEVLEEMWRDAQLKRLELKKKYPEEKTTTSPAIEDVPEIKIDNLIPVDYIAPESLHLLIRMATLIVRLLESDAALRLTPLPKEYNIAADMYQENVMAWNWLINEEHIGPAFVGEITAELLMKVIHLAEAASFCEFDIPRFAAMPENADRMFPVPYNVSLIDILKNMVVKCVPSVMRQALGLPSPTDAFGNPISVATENRILGTMTEYT